MAENGEAYDAATEKALREVYDAAWGKRDEESKFYEQVVIPVPASSCSPSQDYTAKFLRIGGIPYFTQLVRAENGNVLAAVKHAADRRVQYSPSHSSSVIVGQTGVGKSMCLRFALVERLLDRKRTIYLDEAAHILAVYTAEGCRVFRTVDPAGRLCDLQTGQAWAYLEEWAGTAAMEVDPDPVAVDFLLSDSLTTAALIDSDPARPHPPLWLVAFGADWLVVQATSTPPLDYETNKTWASQQMADTVWMDAWSWPEVYAASVHLHGLDAERLERVHEVFVQTPTLEHCIEFSLSQSTVHLLRHWVRAHAKSLVATPNGLYTSLKLLRDQPAVCGAYVDRTSAQFSWLYGVLDPKSRDNHRGRTPSAVTTRIVKPYIMLPRPCEIAGGNFSPRSEARLDIAGDDSREAMQLALAEVEAVRGRAMFAHAYSTSLPVPAC